MSLFERLRPKWKHSDPAVRLEAVRAMCDQSLLTGIAANDASEDVRLAAIDGLTDQEALERLAAAGGVHAVAACAKVADPLALARLAQSSGPAAVRRRAVEGITDRGVLLRVAAADPDPTVRALARARGAGGEMAVTYLREMIAKLPIAGRRAPEVAEFCGTLDAICLTLAKDPRFFINGEMAGTEEDGAVMVPDATQTPWTTPSLPDGHRVARFLAQARIPPEGATAISYYHIKVWRTAEDCFDAVATEKRMGRTSNADAWSRASGSTPWSGAARGDESDAR